MFDSDGEEDQPSAKRVTLEPEERRNEGHAKTDRGREQGREQGRATPSTTGESGTGHLVSRLVDTVPTLTSRMLLRV